MSRTSRITRESADQKMVDGLEKHLSQMAALPVGSVTYSAAQIAQVFKDRIASSQAVTAAAAQHAAAVKADSDKRDQTGSTVRAFRRMAQAMFSQSPDTLATFGLVPPKVATKTVASKSTAVAKAKATRAARHTMGPKQKAKIHGTSASASTGSTDSVEASPPAPTPPPLIPAPAGAVTTSGPATTGTVTTSGPAATPTPAVTANTTR